MFIVESIISVTYSFECSRTINSCESPGILWCHILITVSENAIVLDDSQPSGISAFQLDNFQILFLLCLLVWQGFVKNTLSVESFPVLTLPPRTREQKILTRRLSTGFQAPDEYWWFWLSEYKLFLLILMFSDKIMIICPFQILILYLIVALRQETTSEIQIPKISINSSTDQCPINQYVLECTRLWFLGKAFARRQWTRLKNYVAYKWYLLWSY